MTDSRGVAPGTSGRRADVSSASDPITGQHTAADVSRWIADIESGPVTIATIAVVVVVSAFHSSFFSWTQMTNIIEQNAFVGILACGMAFLLAMRELDLSVGSTLGLTVVCAALLQGSGINPWLTALVAVAAGTGLGLVNAGLVQGIGLPSIIATLGTLSMFRGLAEALSNGQQITNVPAGSSFYTVIGGDFLKVPVGIWCFAAVVVLLTALLRLTPFGYRVRAIGSNPQAASHSGISLPRTRIQVLALMGLLGGVSGVLALGYFSSADPQLGTGYELQAIAAAVIGGTPLSGGNATVAGAAVGAILLGVVNSGLVYFNVPLNWSSFATGSVIIVAVSLDQLLRRRRTSRRLSLGL
ncbi:MAG TPA: ABC transporter permease [Mycobacteriales bacterium]|nr:ABC transporter permease [Mycobacteriales bacterium]